MLFEIGPHNFSVRPTISAGQIEKRFLSGTHRAAAPASLLSDLGDDLFDYGITRVARLTNLDRIGIEVIAVTRPNARGLSVAQGKGCTYEAARLSGIMEAIELWHAENPSTQLVYGTYQSVQHALPRAELDRLLGSALGDRQIYWCDAINLLTGKRLAVPFDLVHACFTDDGRSAGVRFPVSTNGLASGMCREEALVHALCELVERHDTATLANMDPQARAARIIDLADVTDGPARSLIDRLTNAAITFRVWDSTGDVGIASCVAAIADKDRIGTPPGFGAGCHPSPIVALCRALTEAAQSRLTRISGARDDLTGRHFGPCQETRAHWLTGPGSAGERSIETLPDLSTGYIDGDLSAITRRFAEAGHDIVAYVQLSNDERYVVVRAIVPGLLGYETAL